MKPKIGVYAAISDTQIDNNEFVNNVAFLLRKQISKYKGKYFYNFIFKLGYINDDFIKAQQTMVLTANWYKKPRFIK